MQRPTRLFDFACEAAGVFGLVATLMLCLLAFAGVDNAVFWVTVAAAGLGSLVYIVYQGAGWLFKRHGLSGSQIVLATIVPVAALAVTVVVGGERAGLFFLPFGHRDVETQRQVISVEKNADGTVSTTTRPADGDDAE
ncbi:hypothetical protein [uncultured Salinisphaera sp.]|uniref:hypothetical protein n=1 Tax=uncultured Salinisphaera sp. TaxID=359372 RepID=UPI0032B2FE5C|tara:strand:+ start:484 stop:897 length:414 start_codon:yes stop_codon:yes gene_type:complete